MGKKITHQDFTFLSKGEPENRKGIIVTTTPTMPKQVQEEGVYKGFILPVENKYYSTMDVKQFIKDNIDKLPISGFYYPENPDLSDTIADQLNQKQEAEI